MAREKLETQIRQDQIAQAALELVAEGGLGQLSVAAVARRVGLVPSALYRHFKDKDAIIDATLQRVHERLMGNVQAIREETGDAIERLDRLLQRHVRMIRANRGIPQIVFSQDIYAGRPERRARVYQGIRAYLAQVARIIREGQKAGRIHRDLDPHVASVMFLGLIQPSAILSHMSDGAFDATRQARRAWPLYSKALRDGPGQDNIVTK